MAQSVSDASKAATRPYSLPLSLCVPLRASSTHRDLARRAARDKVDLVVHQAEWRRSWARQAVALESAAWELGAALRVQLARLLQSATYGRSDTCWNRAGEDVDRELEILVDNQLIWNRAGGGSVDQTKGSHHRHQNAVGRTSHGGGVREDLLQSLGEQAREEQDATRKMD